MYNLQFANGKYVSTWVPLPHGSSWTSLILVVWFKASALLSLQFTEDRRLEESRGHLTFRTNTQQCAQQTRTRRSSDRNCSPSVCQCRFCCRCESKREGSDGERARRTDAKKKESEKEVLSRRTNLLLFHQPTTLRTDGHYIVYFTYVPAYTKRHARRDFDRDHSRYSQTVSRREIGDRSHASLATKMYTSCSKDYIYIYGPRDKLPFFWLPFLFFTFVVFAARTPFLLSVNHRECHVQTANAYRLGNRAL